MIRRAFIASLLCCGAIVLVGGCAGGSSAPTLADAGGTVTYQGSPLAGAVVTFVPEKGPIASGTTDLEGKFTLSTGTLSGVAVGNARVSVTALAAGDQTQAPTTQATNPEDMAKMMRQWAETEGADDAGRPKSLIPEKYGSVDSSGLVFVVKEGEQNQFQIDLKN